MNWIDEIEKYINTPLNLFNMKDHTDSWIMPENSTWILFTVNNYTGESTNHKLDTLFTISNIVHKYSISKMNRNINNKLSKIIIKYIFS